VHDIKKLWSYLPRRRQKQFGLVLILMILASFAEIMSIGAVLPFLGMLTAPDQFFYHPIMQQFLQVLMPIFGMSILVEPDQILLPLTILFIVATIISGIIRLMLLFVMTRLSFSTGADLSVNIYQRTLYQKYSVHVMRNSSEVINSIIVKTGTVIGGVVTPVLTIISATILTVGIIGALLIIDTTIAFSALIVFSVLYLSVSYYTRSQLNRNSKVIADNSTQMIKSLQEGLGGIRDVLIDQSQQFYCKLYRDADLPLRIASGNNKFITSSPKNVIEAFGMSFIAIAAYLMSQQPSQLTVIPILGALALGAQRLLPALQQIYSSFSTIKGNKSSFQDMLELLEQPLPKDIDNSSLIPIPFNNEIKLDKLNFRYSEDTPLVIRDVSLEIPKGSRIGFVGETGSGKSTLIDLIMGLISPTTGTLKIDGNTITNENVREWQAHIAHVSQNIYLSDSTIEENIAFAIPKDQINHKHVEEAVNKAQLSDLIEGWKDGYKTYVGERGVRLSGGQRQRIGIARALYKRANVLVFDEATSALDNDTELAVMESIESLGSDLTILIIAHRLTTLKNCDNIFRVDKGGVTQIGSYQQLIKN